MTIKTSITTSLLAASALFMAAGMAQATTLTFASTADCNTSEVSIASPPGGSFGPCALGGSPGGSALVQLGEGLSYWEAVFTNVVSNVSIDLGDFNQDADRLFLWAWDASNVMIGFTELDIAADFVGMQTLTLALSGVKSVAFGVYGSGIYADNLEYTVDTPAVPVPAALPLLLTGLGALGAAGWRRKRNAA